MTEATKSQEKKSSSDLVHLHILIPKKLNDELLSVCNFRGERSYLVRRILEDFFSRAKQVKSPAQGKEKSSAESKPHRKS